MMESIRQFFLNNLAEPDSKEDEALPADLRLAACALLLELAYADDEFTDDEREHLAVVLEAREAPFDRDVDAACEFGKAGDLGAADDLGAD